MPAKSTNSRTSRGSRSKKKKSSKPKSTPQAEAPAPQENPPTVVETVVNGSATNTHSYDEVTINSSTLGSVTSSKMRMMFPPTNVPTSFNEGTNLYAILIDSINLPEDMLVQLAHLGLTTPSSIGNSFGLSDKTVVQSFLQLGYHMIGQEGTPSCNACLKLFMFGRALILKKKMLPEEDLDEAQWNSFKQGATFDKKFNEYTAL